MQVSEVVEVIKQVPDQFLATVQPLTSISKDKLVDTGSVLYSEIRLVSPSVAPMATRQAPPIPEILISRNELSPLPKLDASPAPSLDDVGYYDDEDDGDIPPPLPPRTEDALVILDPPPISGEGERERERERERREREREGERGRESEREGEKERKRGRGRERERDYVTPFPPNIS